MYKFSSPYIWNKKVDQFCKSFRLDESESCYCSVVNLINDKVLLKKHWLYKTVDIKFCDKIFKSPKNYELFLQNSYAKDYMILHPKSEQIAGDEKNYITE